MLERCTHIFSSLSRLHRFVNRCIWRWQISLALQLMIPHAGFPRGRRRPRHCGWCGGHIRGHAENKTQATLGEYKYIYQGQKKARVEGRPDHNASRVWQNSKVIFKTLRIFYLSWLVCNHLQGVPSQNMFFKRAKNVRKSICR